MGRHKIMLMLTTMKKYNLKKIGSVLLIAAAAGIYMACQPEDFYGDNGFDNSDLGASFTITPVVGKVNTYVLNAENNGSALAFYWNKGNGKWLVGHQRDSVVLPDADTYDIQLKVVGKGGVTAIDSKELVVENSDPV